jgi:hypothetical protein
MLAFLIGIVIAVGSWAPLWIVEATDRYAMPVGLGIFAIVGSFIGGTIAVIGLVRLLIRTVREANRTNGS